MSQAPIESIAPAQQDAQALVAAITETLRCQAGPETTLSRWFYDSFDWRLFAAGLSLEWGLLESEAGEIATAARPESCPRSGAAADAGVSEGSAGAAVVSSLCLRRLKDPAAAPLLQPQAGEPGLLEAMASGPVRDRLAGVLAMRRLLPLVEVITQRRWLQLLNEEAETVAWLTIEQNRFRDLADGEAGQLSTRLRLEPVRGDSKKPYKRVRRLLRERLGLQRADEPVVLEALRAAGRRPGWYSSKLDDTLAPEQRADLATKQILRGLLETLEANVDGARQNLDSEFLHDLRVATRRTRSALAQIKDVFPAEVVADFKTRFAWLQQVTGPMRDLDVYLLDFPALQQRLPAALQADLQPLQRLLSNQYQAVQRELAQELASEPFRALLRDWRAFLEAPVADRPAASDSPVSAQQPEPALGAPPKRALQPIKRVADQRIRKLLARVRAEGRAITDASPPEELHELRKSCKKLRYLMEFFQSLYETARIREQIKQTKVLLDNLGRFQDTAVQAQHLRETAESAGCREGGLPPATLLAMGLLIGQLQDEQRRARSGFSEVFRGFDSEANLARFEALLSGGKRSKQRA